MKPKRPTEQKCERCGKTFEIKYHSFYRPGLKRFCDGCGCQRQLYAKMRKPPTDRGQKERSR